MKSGWFLKYIPGWLHAHDLLISSVHLRFPPLLSYKLTSIDHVTPSNMYPNTLFLLPSNIPAPHIRPLIRSGHSMYSGYPPILGIVTVGNCPDCTFVHIRTLAFPSLPCLAASLCASLPIIFRLPHPVIVPINPPSPYPALWGWAGCFHCYWAISRQLFC